MHCLCIRALSSRCGTHKKEPLVMNVGYAGLRSPAPTHKNHCVAPLCGVPYNPLSATFLETSLVEIPVYIGVVQHTKTQREPLGPAVSALEPLTSVAAASPATTNQRHTHARGEPHSVNFLFNKSRRTVHAQRCVRGLLQYY